MPTNAESRLSRAVRNFSEFQQASNTMNKGFMEEGLFLLDGVIEKATEMKNDELSHLAYAAQDALRYGLLAETRFIFALRALALLSAKVDALRSTSPEKVISSSDEDKNIEKAKEASAQRQKKIAKLYTKRRKILDRVLYG